MKPTLIFAAVLACSIVLGDLKPEAPPVELSDVVVTVTGGKQDRFDTALPVNVIDTRKMEETIAVSPADLFRYEPGVDAVVTGPGSVHPMIRGLSGERVLVLVDGIRLSEQRPGGNHAFSLDPAQIERVEVVRGPASVLYGSDAIGGVINFITKRVPAQISEEGYANGEIFGQVQSNGEGYKPGIHLRLGKGGWNGYGGVAYTDTDDIENPDGTVGNSFYEGTTAWVGGNYTGDNWTVYTDLSVMEADIGIPGAVAFAEDYFKGERHLRLATGIYAENVSETLERIGIDFGWQRHNRNRYRRKTTGLPGPVQGDLAVEIGVDIDTYTAKPQAVFVIGDNQRLTMGLDFFYENATSDRTLRDTASAWVNPKYSGVPVIPDSTRLGIGAFIQDEINLGDRWVFTPGVRFDWIEASTDGHPRHQVSGSDNNISKAASGSLGMLYKWSNELNLYANAGRAFRAPTLLELYFDGPHDVASDLGNPDLNPETSWNFDIGAKWRSGRIQAMAGLFYNMIDDYIAKEKQTNGDYFYKNYADVELWGGEAGMDMDLGWGVSAYISGSLVYGENKDDDEDLSGVPPVKFRYGIRYDTTLDDIGVWVELAGTTALKQNQVAANERDTDGYTIGDLRFGVDVNEVWSVIFAVENFADVLYEDHLSSAWQDGGISAQPGRNFKLMVKGRF